MIQLCHINNIAVTYMNESNLILISIPMYFESQFLFSKEVRNISQEDPCFGCSRLSLISLEHPPGF